MNTVDRIVHATGELLRVRGYGSTSIKQIAEAAGAPVGSIYHHFPGGKRDVVAAALRSSGAVYIALIPLLLDPYDDLVAGVRAAFGSAAQDMESNGWMNMCPVGTVTGEVADLEPDLRAVSTEVLAGWVRDATAYFSHRGLPEPDARALTFSLLSALEGAFVLARGLRSREPLLAAGEAQASYAAGLLARVNA